MSLSLEDVFFQIGDLYKIKLLAGQNGCSNSIGWVHNIEDIKIVDFLWSNDLVITRGVGFQEEDALFDCVKKLNKKHCIGLIINTGEYIQEVPKKIIEFCDENNFPLMEIPWEINITEVIREISYRCLEAQNSDETLASYFIQSFNDPAQIQIYRKDLMSQFDVDGTFKIVLINIENVDDYSHLSLQRLSARIRYYFEKIDGKYLLFWYDTSLVLIVNNIQEDEVVRLCQKMYNRATKKMPEFPLHIGLGSEVKDITNVPIGYNRAKAALKASILFHNPLCEFSKLGIYQLLLMNTDTDLLNEFYYSHLKPLIEYDQVHHTELLNTFEQYIHYNGSIQKISKELFTHRNTINYRVSKIKELLNSNLDDTEQLFQYQLAFHIKKINGA